MMQELEGAAESGVREEAGEAGGGRNSGRSSKVEGKSRAEAEAAEAEMEGERGRRGAAAFESSKSSSSSGLKTLVSSPMTAAGQSAEGASKGSKSSSSSWLETLVYPISRYSLDSQA